MMGSQRESWRFKGSDPKPPPRAQTVEKGDVFNDVSTVLPSKLPTRAVFDVNQDFKEIPQSFLQEDDWQLCFAAKIEIREHITLLEGRGIVAALRYKLRNSSNFGMRHLHFNDNLAAVLITDKGRSSSPSMPRVSRRLAALLLASGCALCPRWIPSEWNVADKGSRRWEAERREEEEYSKGIKKFKERLIYPRDARSTQLRSDQAAPFPTDQAESGDCESQHSATSSWSPRQEPRGTAGESSGCVQRAGISTQVPWTDFVGAEGGIGFSGTRLHSEISRISGVLPHKWDEPSQRDQIRRSSLHLSESHVRGRERHQRRKQGLCKRAGCAPQLRREAELGKEQTGTSGMEQVRPRQYQTSLGMGFDRQDRHDDAGSWEDHGSPGHHSDVRMLPATRRGSPLAGRRLGKTRRRPPALCIEPSSSGSSRRIKGRTSGRNHNDRLSGGSKPRSLPSTPADRTEEKLPPKVGVPTAEERMGPLPSGVGAASELCSSLSAETFRPLAGSIDELSCPERGQEAREVASRFVAAALRGTCPSGAGIPKVAYPDSGGLHCSRGSFSEGAPKVLLPAKAQDKNKWLIEIFSGSCHLSAAAVRAGYRVLAIDILYGSSCDILSPAVRQAIREFAVKHPVALVWFGMPCQSWSHARIWDGGPPPLRDD